MLPSRPAPTGSTVRSGMRARPSETAIMVVCIRSMQSAMGSRALISAPPRMRSFTLAPRSDLGVSANRVGGRKVKVAKGEKAMRRIRAAWMAIGVMALGTPSLAATAPTLLHISSHLPKAAKASLDGGKVVTAPGYGSTLVAVTAGSHVLKVTTSTGATYQT